MAIIKLTGSRRFSIPFKITTWNVNSVRKRLDGLAALIEEEAPDVICLQETKVQDHLFPASDIAGMGYPHQSVYGMKSYNGVAILSRHPLQNPERVDNLGREDCRHLLARVDAGGTLGEIEVHCLYVPAGGDIADPVKNPKFAYKLDFVDALTHLWAARGAEGLPRFLVGDFNIAPYENDVWSHARLKNTVTHTEIEIKRLQNMQRAGRWVDIMRWFLGEDEEPFTWWSYRAADWQEANKGRRLDHIWANPSAAEKVDNVRILRDARDWPGPSDHVPVTVSLNSGSGST